MTRYRLRMRTLVITYNSRQHQPWRWHIVAGGRITSGSTEQYHNRRDMVKTMEKDLGGHLVTAARTFYRWNGSGLTEMPVVFAKE